MLPGIQHALALEAQSDLKKPNQSTQQVMKFLSRKLEKENLDSFILVIMALFNTYFQNKTKIRQFQQQDIQRLIFCVNILLIYCITAICNSLLRYTAVQSKEEDREEMNSPSSSELRYSVEWYLPYYENKVAHLESGILLHVRQSRYKIGVPNNPVANNHF